MTATRQQIVAHAHTLNLNEIINNNWGIPPLNQPHYWHVDADTYINGVPVIVDLDLSNGYLLEVVERDTLNLSYVVV